MRLSYFALAHLNALIRSLACNFGSQIANVVPVQALLKRQRTRTEADRSPALMTMLRTHPFASLLVNIPLSKRPHQRRGSATSHSPFTPCSSHAGPPSPQPHHPPHLLPQPRPPSSRWRLFQLLCQIAKIFRLARRPHDLLPQRPPPREIVVQQTVGGVDFGRFIAGGTSRGDGETAPEDRLESMLRRAESIGGPEGEEAGVVGGNLLREGVRCTNRRWEGRAGGSYLTRHDHEVR